MKRKIDTWISWLFLNSIFWGITYEWLFLKNEQFGNAFKFLLWLFFIISVLTFLGSLTHPQKHKIVVPHSFIFAVDLIVSLFIASFGYYLYAVIYIVSTMLQLAAHEKYHEN